MKYISFAIPCYNSQKQLEEVVEKVTEELKKTKPNFCELSDTKQEEKKKKCKINGGENDRS